MKLTWLRYVLLTLTLLIGLLIYKGWASDIPHEVLAAKYATGASDFIELPSGATAHYRMQGNDEGITVILLHGSNASLHTWEGWVDELEDDYFVVTVDLPGHGLTGGTPSSDYTYSGMVAFLAEFTETLGLKNFVLGGNSMGGAVSLKYALTYPDTLKGLILVDSAGINTPAAALGKVDFPLAFDLAGHWYSSWILNNVTPRSVVKEGLEKTLTDHTLINDHMINRYWELALHPGNRQATNKRFAWYRDDRRELSVKDVALPTLIIWGEDDKLIPVEVAHELDKRIANSELVVFEGLGHIPMEESPLKTVKPAKDFIASVVSNIS